MIYWTTCKNLILSDLLVYKQMIFDKIINVGVWVGLTLIVVSYVMPFFGLANFGPVQFGGVIAAVGLFELHSNIIDVVSDIEGDRVINYQLTLPVPSVLVLLSKSIYYFITYSTITFVMIPFGCLCLGNQVELLTISWYKLILAILFQSAFYASFVLWAASTVRTIGHLGNIWRRFIHPMWFLGGFQFSWLALHQVMPVLAYLNAMNPMIYITECTRVALLGQAGYVNFWLCLLAIACFSVACFVIGFYNLKKRLDFV